MRRRIAWFFLVTALLLAGRAGAQCQNGSGFAVCPGADRIYINTDKRLGALRLSDAGTLWQIDLPPREESYTATEATKDTVAVWAGFPNTGIYAFDAKSGKLLWHVDTSSYGVTSAGAYLVFSDAEHWEALTAVDERTGKKIWHHSGNRPTRGGVVLLDSTDRTIITELFAMDSNSGEVLKRWPRAWTVSAEALGDKFVVIGTRYAESKTNKLAAYSLPGYKMRWVRDSPEGKEVAEIAADADRVFAAVYPRAWDRSRPGQADLVLLDASSGDAIWTEKVNSRGLLAGPIGLSQGVGVFTTAESAKSSTVQSFDAATGQLKWMVRTDHRINGVTCVGSSCYVGGEVGEVLAVDVRTGAQRWYRIPL